MDTLLNDLRYALRGLRRDPVFTIAALATLALALGANAAIFTLSHALLVRPLPYSEPDRIVEIEHPPFSFGPDGFRLGREVRESPLLESSSLYYPEGGANLERESESLRVDVAQVDVTFLRTLGSAPMLGRDFADAEGVQGANRVMLLSEAVWRERFAADPGVIGSTVRLTGITYTIVGVMPSRFEFPAGADVWVPNPVTFAFVGGAFAPSALARVRAGVDRTVAETELAAAADARRSGAAPDPTLTGDPKLRLIPLRDELTRTLRAPILVLLAAVLIVVAIGCANLSGLFLARISGREREFGVRGALGAGSGRIARQIVTESIVLAVLGGSLAVLLAWWTLDGIVALFPTGLLPTQNFEPGMATALYTGAVAMGVAFLFALAPALHASRAARRIPGSGSIGHDPSRVRLRSGLLVAEVALSFVLIASAGLLVRTMARLNDVPLGFEPASVMSMKLRLPETRYDDTRWSAFTADLLDRVRRVPGVRAAAAGNDLPLGGAMGSGFRVLHPEDVDMTVDRQYDGESASYRVATRDWFRVMGTAVTEGRVFSDEDDRGEHVFIINRQLADRMFPGGGAVGRQIALHGGRNARFGTVVGVVDGVRHSSVTAEPQPEIYVPFGQAPVPYISLVARVDGNRGAVREAIEAGLRELDAGVPLYEVRMMSDVVTASLGSRRGVTIVMSLFAILALVVSAVGLYGLIAQSVAQRRREIGVRVALGAGRSGVVGLILRRGIVLAAWGTGIGILAAAAATRVLSSQLYGVEPLDPLTFLGVTALLVGVSAAASALPAARAARVDPMAALREE